jgi:hypothetical protein
MPTWFLAPIAGLKLPTLELDVKSRKSRKEVRREEHRSQEKIKD